MGIVKLTTLLWNTESDIVECFICVLILPMLQQTPIRLFFSTCRPPSPAGYGHFVPGHFVPGHFVPGQFVPGHFIPRLGHFVLKI